MTGVRVNYGETHAAIQVEEIGNRTNVVLACGPTLHIDATNSDRFTIVQDPPNINCFICNEKTEQEPVEL